MDCTAVERTLAMTTTAVDTDEIELEPGTRVTIHGNPINVTLRSHTGTIVRPDIWIDCYIVLLDEPAMYRNIDDTLEYLA